MMRDDDTLNTVHRRFDGVETRLDGVEAKLDGVEAKLDGVAGDAAARRDG